MIRRLLCLAAALAVALPAPALTLTVDPVTGIPGGNPTNSISDALSQINLGPDAVNTVQLVSTAVHVVPNAQVWTINAGKTVNIVAFSGRPVIRLSSGTTGNLRLAVPDLAVLTVTGIDIIPQAGIAYANNANDSIYASANGLNTAQTVQGGQITFTDCIFSANNGSDAPAGLVPFNNSGNNFGDDLIQARSIHITFSNCLITGVWDDAILQGADGTLVASVTLNNGTAIAEIGGAGIQVYNRNTTMNLDGSGGRVQIANVGRRTGTDDTGIKWFWDNGCAMTIQKADISGCTNAAIYDFEGVPTITIEDSRIALSNSNSAVPGGNFVINDTSNDSAYAQTINLTRSTFHDSLGAAPNGSGLRFVNDNANDPQPTWTLLDSIVSGANDDFPMLGNAPTAVNKSFTAVVEAGPDAVGSVGDLGTSTLNSDPAYASYTLTLGRAQANPDFLRPTNAAYLTASSTSGIIGGAQPPAQVDEWSLF